MQHLAGDRDHDHFELRVDRLGPGGLTAHLGIGRYDPDLWTDEFAFLNLEGQAHIQTELFFDYRNNVASYPAWQTWMRENQPSMLVLWGRYDPSFELSEPDAYKRDVPEAEIYILDGGHFALDTSADEIADLIDAFLKKNRRSRTLRPL